MRVAVIGGGPAGIAAAHHLTHAFASSESSVPLDLVVYEAASGVGGDNAIFY